MKRQFLSLLIAGCLAACGSNSAPPDQPIDMAKADPPPGPDMAKPDPPAGPDMAKPDQAPAPDMTTVVSWFGDFAAERIDWTYSCDNGSSGSAFNENVSTLRVSPITGSDHILITQTDLSDPQTWECQLSGSTATVVATVDTTTDTSDFGVHSAGSVTVKSMTGQFTLAADGTISTEWHAEYKQGVANCVQDITGKFNRAP